MVDYRRANRQYVAMSRKAVWAFLGSRRRVFLGFAMDGGYAHVTPIWFVTKGERVYVRAQSYKVKVGLAAKGKACLSIDAGEDYRELRGVVMWGSSRILTEKKLSAEVTALFEKKYADAQWRAKEMPRAWVDERNKETRAIIEFVPEKVDSWDNRKVR